MEKANQDTLLGHSIAVQSMRFSSQSVSQSFNQSGRLLVRQTVIQVHSEDQSVNFLVSQSVSQSESYRKSVSGSVRKEVSQSLSHSVRQSVSQSDSQYVSQSASITQYWKAPRVFKKNIRRHHKMGAEEDTKCSLEKGAFYTWDEHLWANSATSCYYERHFITPKASLCPSGVETSRNRDRQAKGTQI